MTACEGGLVMERHPGILYAACASLTCPKARPIMEIQVKEIEQRKLAQAGKPGLPMVELH
jgi:hypothetical protein